MARLVVLVSGIRTGFPLLKGLQNRGALADSVWVSFTYGYYSILTAIFPRRRARIVSTLCRFIDQTWMRGEFDDLVLVGVEGGTMLVRRAYVQAQADRTSPWAGKVSGILLLSDTSDWNSSRGSATEVLIDWVQQLKAIETASNPVVVEVSEREPRDRAPSVPRTVEISLTSSIRSNAPTNSVDSAAFSRIQEALTSTLPDSSRESAPKQRIVFVLHGIRANRHTWVQDVKSLIKERDPNAIVIANGYGWFSALTFALPWTRRRPIGWFQDQYLLALRRFPNAEFSFIGHSNGTYILGRSLQSLRGIRFSRIALTGSVLPMDYDWDTRVAFEQIKELRNDRANRDWPVAFLCSALRGIGMKDVGTGGFDGFNSVTLQKHDEVFWHDGGHSAAVDNLRSLEAIVDFTMFGSSILPAIVPNVSPVFVTVSARLPILVTLAFCAACLAALWLAWPAIASLHLAMWVMVSIAGIVMLMLLLRVY
jgi:hypothetical protein